MKDKRIPFTAISCLLESESRGIAWYQRAERRGHVRLCGDELRTLFTMPNQCLHFTLVFSERTHPDAYPITFWKSTNSMPYDLPVVGGLIMMMLWPAEELMHLIWDAGYNYVRMEL